MSPSPARPSRASGRIGREGRGQRAEGRKGLRKPGAACRLYLPSALCPLPSTPTCSQIADRLDLPPVLQHVLADVDQEPGPGNVIAPEVLPGGQLLGREGRGELVQIGETAIDARQQGRRIRRGGGELRVALARQRLTEAKVQQIIARL